MFKKKQRSATVVGLDLDPSHIAAAEVHVNGSVTVKKGAIVALRPGVLRDGEASDPVALAEALRELFDANDLPKRVRLGIANQRIVVRSLDLPVIEDPKGLAAAVQAGGARPHPDADGRGRRRLPVARRRRHAGRPALARGDRRGPPRDDRPARLGRPARPAWSSRASTSSAFGMVRALAPAATEQAVLYINVAGLTNVAVANGSGCLFTRAAAGGLDAAVHTLAERRGLTHEHAAPVDAARRPAHAARGGRGRARARGRHARRARGGRAPARRHRPQLAELLPDAGGRRDRRARPADGPRAGHPRLRGASSRSSSSCPSSPRSWSSTATRTELDPARLAVAAGLAIEDRV